MVLFSSSCSNLGFFREEVVAAADEAPRGLRGARSFFSTTDSLVAEGSRFLRGLEARVLAVVAGDAPLAWRLPALVAGVGKVCRTAELPATPWPRPSPASVL